MPEVDFLGMSPNPSTGNNIVKVIMDINRSTNLTIYSVNQLTGIRNTLIEQPSVSAQSAYEIDLDVSALSSGVNFIVIKTDNNMYFKNLLKH